MKLVYKLMRVTFHFNMGVLMAVIVLTGWYFLEAMTNGSGSGRHEGERNHPAFCCLSRIDGGPSGKQLLAR
jgi:hypothetical protein